MQTCEKAIKAITLPCPFCGEENAGIELRLWELDNDEQQFKCVECDAEFGRERIAELVRRWGKLLAWLEQAPDCD